MQFLRTPMPNIIMLDADGFQYNTEPALVLMTIKRSEVEAQVTGSILERLLILVDTLENVMLYKESLMFQVEGYDDDPRELCEVPEVRAFFGKITQKWPFFVWFIARGFGGLAFYFSLCCRTTVSRDAEGASTGYCIEDRTEIIERFRSLVRRSNPVLSSLGVTDDHLIASLKSATAEII